MVFSFVKQPYAYGRSTKTMSGNAFSWLDSAIVDYLLSCIWPGILYSKTSKNKNTYSVYTTICRVYIEEKKLQIRISESIKL